jgi:hypothetical protein
VWPALPLEEKGGRDAYATLRVWAQVVCKILLA